MYTDFCGFRTHEQKSFTLSYCTCSFVVPSFAMLKRATPFLSSLFYSIIQVHSQAPDHRILYSARISFQSSELGPNPFSSPLLGQTVGDTLTCGEGGVGTQFRQRDRHSDSLCLLYNPQNAPDTDILLMLVSQLCQWHRQGKTLLGCD